MATLQKIRNKGPLLVIVIGLALFAFIAEEAMRSIQSASNESRQRVGEVYGEHLSVHEFQNLVDEYAEVVKFTTGNTALNDAQLTQLRDQVWNTFVNNKLIEREAGRLLCMIDEVLKLSFLDEQHDLAHTLPMQKLSLKAIIHNVLERLKLIAQKQHISIRTKLEDCTIMGNAELIENLVYNLCDNAIKYNKPNGAVHIALHKHEKGVILEVRDSGVGIPKDAQSRVFERFFCVDKGRSKQLGGTGLGLSIVESVAHYHNASVNLKSKIGEGSTFSVRFGGV